MFCASCMVNSYFLQEVDYILLFINRSFFFDKMTQDQDIELRNFEARVRQLMLAYQEERQRNAELQKKLDTCQQELADAQSCVEKWKKDYEMLKTARMIEVSGDDVKESRAKLNQLIREVDKCIALLDV